MREELRHSVVALQRQKTWRDTYYNAMAKGVPEDKARKLADAVANSWKRKQP